jgi:hypothetical protein
MNEGDCRALLRALEGKYPIKDWKPGDITLLFAGWGMGQAMLKRKVIVMPRYWLKRPIVAEFAIVHEYAHFYREHMGRKKRLLGFHDKEMKRIESWLMGENGITLRRWVRYPREIHSKRFGQWRAPYDLPAIDIILGAINWNSWGVLAAIIATHRDETTLVAIYFFLALWFVNWIDGAVANTVQNIRWLRHWWVKRNEGYDKLVCEVLEDGGGVV